MPAMQNFMSVHDTDTINSLFTGKISSIVLYGQTFSIGFLSNRRNLAKIAYRRRSANRGISADIARVRTLSKSAKYETPIRALPRARAYRRFAIRHSFQPSLPFVTLHFILRFTTGYQTADSYPIMFLRSISPPFSAYAPLSLESCHLYSPVPFSLLG